MVRLFQVQASLIMAALLVFLVVLIQGERVAFSRLNSPTGILMRAEGLETKANATLVNLDKASASLQTAGVAVAAHANDQADRLTLLIDNANQDAVELRGLLVTLNAEVPKLDPLLASATKAADSIPPVSEQLVDTLDRAGKTADATTVTVAAAGSVVSSTDVTQAAHSVSVILANAAGASSDFRARFHTVLYPSPCTGKWCWARRLYPVVRDGAPLLSDTYWAVQLFRNVAPVR